MASMIRVAGCMGLRFEGLGSEDLGVRGLG